MLRFIKISFLGLAVLGLGNAGQIRVGGVNGLTSGYITGGCSGTPGTCTAGSAAAWSEKNYNTDLFTSATGPGATQPSAYAGYSNTVASTGSIVDAADGVTFSMINDGTSGGRSNNVWIAGENITANPVITIPIGVFAVQDVWTMLNADLGGASPKRDAWVIFDFGATSNATVGLTSVIVKLTNSANSNVPTGQLRNAVDCTAGCAGDNAGANGPTLASTVGAGGAIPVGITLKTSPLYSFAYTAGGQGTAGDVVLDAQQFTFTGGTLTTALNNFLVDIKVQQVGATTTSTVGLSAITLDTAVAATPEPSTIFLLLTGLGAIGFARTRRTS